MSSALVRKKMAKLKTKIFFEMIDGIITEYPNINNFIQRNLIEKCDREEISIDEVRLEPKPFLQTKHVLYQSQDMLLADLNMFYQERPSLCISKGIQLVYSKEFTFKITKRDFLYINLVWCLYFS